MVPVLSGFMTDIGVFIHGSANEVWNAILHGTGAE
jgi:hypothetical protein